MSHLNRVSFAVILMILSIFVFVPTQAHANTEARIINFTVSPNPMPIGTTELTISWATENAQTIELSYGSDDRPHRATREQLPSSGTRTLTMDGNSVSEPYVAYWGAYLDFISLSANGESGSDNSDEITHRIRCTSDSWFFANPPEECPYISRNARPMSIQHFEHGVMIWTDYDLVVLTDRDGQKGRMCCFGTGFAWTPDMPEDSNPNLTPPPGLFKPIKQFGVAWAFEPIRTALGWAVDEAEEYSGFSQCHNLSIGDNWGECYYGTSSNQIYAVNVPQQADVWRVIYRDITAERGSTPNTPTPAPSPTPPTNGQPCPASGAWPAGCNPNATPPTTPTPPTDGQPCPASGVWPAGCNPNATPPDTPTPPTGDQPCPTSGVWPAGCNPNATPPTTPTPPTQGQPCPASGVWPAGCNPNLTPSTPPPHNDTCVIPASGPWPACAR